MFLLTYFNGLIKHIFRPFVGDIPMNRVVCRLICFYLCFIFQSRELPTKYYFLVHLWNFETVSFIPFSIHCISKQFFHFFYSFVYLSLTNKKLPTYQGSIFTKPKHCVSMHFFLKKICNFKEIRNLNKY